MSIPTQPQQRPTALPLDTLRVSLFVSVLQGLLVATWVTYALYLPGLAAKAGLPAAWVVWLLLIDQLVFAASDWAAGVYTDRVARSLRRIGPAVLLASLLSAALLCMLPTVAALGSPTLLVAITLLWASTSSMLRAPVFSMLGHIGGVSRRSGAVSLSLVGVSLAGALGPLLTGSLRQLDPTWPLIWASVLLVLASLPALLIEPPRPQRALPPVSSRSLQPVIVVSLASGLAAFAVQLFTVLLPMQFGAAQAVLKSVWAPLFWGGFSLGLFTGAVLHQARRPTRWQLHAMWLGALAMALAAVPGPVWLQGLWVALAGGCWAVAYTGGLLAVLRLGQGGGVATPLGIYLSTLALAVAGRLSLSATGLAPSLSAAWLAAGVLVLGCACLWAMQRRLEEAQAVDVVDAVEASSTATSKRA